MPRLVSHASPNVALIYKRNVQTDQHVLKLLMVTRSLDIAALAAQADRDEGLFGDHLRRLLVSLSKDTQLTDIMRRVLHDEPCPTPESFYRLRSAGVLVGESARDVRPRCRLYETYLTRHLL